MLTESLSERVDRGAALLTERLGEGWWDRVNPVTLQVSSRERCVLGQLFDDRADEDELGYEVGVRLLFGQYDREVCASYGFTSAFGDSYHPEVSGYSPFGRLDDLWREKLLALSA